MIKLYKKISQRNNAHEIQDDGFLKCKEAGVPYHMFNMVIIKMLAFVFGGAFSSIYNLI